MFGMFNRTMKNPGRAAIHSGVFLLLYIVLAFVAIPTFHWAFGYFAGLTLGQLSATAAATALTMRIFVDLPLPAAGLPWTKSSARNGLFGLLGGAGSALLVIAVPLALHWAHFEPSTGSGANWRTALFFPMLILAGAAAEELLFHGFAFQTLFREIGPWATILPIGLLFGFLHNDNPNHTNLSFFNTTGFGILFGLAFIRSHDLWLPTGLHFGWNVVLPLVGADLSGITIEPTGVTLVWTASQLISGGKYGPEASILTTAVLFLLLVYILKIPVHKQYAPLLSVSPSPSAPPEDNLPPKTEWNSSAASPPNTQP